MPRLRASSFAPLLGTAAVPGDKSLSHRALILGALADGETEITGLLEADDVRATVRALRAFGVEVEGIRGEWRVRGGVWRQPAGAIDCGNSGTAARLLLGAASRLRLRATFTGDESLRRRPMDRVLQPLAQMGARFEGADRLPLTLLGGPLRGLDWTNRLASAQVKSALLLAGLGASGPVRIVEPRPTRDHTEIMLGQFGCELAVTDSVQGRMIVLGERRGLQGCRLAIAGDTSSASFLWLAAAIVAGSEVRTPGVLANPLRMGFLDALERMGARVRRANLRRRSGELVADVTVSHGALRPARIAGPEIPAMIDEVPALAIAAAFAKGETLIEGLSELRFKESDRLAAIVAGLNACGVAAEVCGNALRIVGSGEVGGGAEIESRGDHRIAMAFAVLGLAARRPVVLDGAEMIATSFPGFAETVRSIGARMDELE